MRKEEDRFHFRGYRAGCPLRLAVSRTQNNWEEGCLTYLCFPGTEISDKVQHYHTGVPEEKAGKKRTSKREFEKDKVSEFFGIKERHKSSEL